MGLSKYVYQHDAASTPVHIRDWFPDGEYATYVHTGFYCLLPFRKQAVSHTPFPKAYVSLFPFVEAELQ